MREAQRSASASPRRSQAAIVALLSDTDEDSSANSQRDRHGRPSPNDGWDLSVPTAEQVTLVAEGAAAMRGRAPLHTCGPRYHYPSVGSTDAFDAPPKLKQGRSHRTTHGDALQDEARDAVRVDVGAGTTSATVTSAVAAHHSPAPPRVVPTRHHRTRLHRDDLTPSDTAVDAMLQQSSVQQLIHRRQQESCFVPHTRVGALVPGCTQQLLTAHDAAFNAELHRDKVLLARKAALEDTYRKKAFVHAQRAAAGGGGGGDTAAGGLPDGPVHQGNHRRTSFCIRRGGSTSLTPRGTIQGSEMAQRALPRDAFPESRKIMYHATVAQRALDKGPAAQVPLPPRSVEAVVHPTFVLNQSRRYMERRTKSVSKKAIVSATITADEFAAEVAASVDSFERAHRLVQPDDD